MLLAQLQRAETRNAGNGQFHAGFLDHQTRTNDLIGGFALVDAAQYLIRAGFQTQIDHIQTQIVQHVQIFLLFAQNGRRRAIAGNALTFRKYLLDVAQDFCHVLGTAHQRIAVCQKNTADTAVHAACLVKICLDLLQLAYAETLFLVHIAEGALVVAAADGDLHNQAVCLRGRTKNSAFVFNHG